VAALEQLQDHLVVVQQGRQRDHLEVALPPEGRSIGRLDQIRANARRAQPLGQGGRPRRPRMPPSMSSVSHSAPNANPAICRIVGAPMATGVRPTDQPSS